MGPTLLWYEEGHPFSPKICRRAGTPQEPQLWTQQAYDRIARITSELAKEKGFGLVLAVDPNGLPLSETFSSMIAMQKVVYSGGCPDLTDEVKAKLAAAKP